MTTNPSTRVQRVCSPYLTAFIHLPFSQVDLLDSAARGCGAHMSEIFQQPLAVVVIFNQTNSKKSELLNLRWWSCCHFFFLKKDLNVFSIWNNLELGFSHSQITVFFIQVDAMMPCGLQDFCWQFVNALEKISHTF